MPKGISVSEAAERLANAGLTFGDRYSKGATGKGGKWAQAAGAAEQNFKEGMTRALAGSLFSKGVSAAGAGAYDEGVRTKGVNNWGTGMQVAGPKYQRKVQPFVSLWTQPLATPRGAKRSPANLKRMTENVDRFQKVKGA